LIENNNYYYNSLTVETTNLEHFETRIIMTYFSWL